MVSEDGKSIIGSVYLVKAEDAAAAEALVRTDPYTKAGVFQSLQQHRFVPAAGTWIGGTRWGTVVEREPGLWD